ncbi:MAG TPA: mechanosensitive ion channel domain-containing protein [Candidatus Sulfotelmatobacter sp.]|nr:mechanosensitive ion channel domain-containing protein [Candidatus Sulfotelmatobacter sp.]
MFLRFRRASAGALAALVLALLLPGIGPGALAQAPATIRGDHQAEDLGRLLDSAHGQNIVVQIAPAAGPPASRGERLEASVATWWQDAADDFQAGLDRGIQGTRALPRLVDDFERSWDARRNAGSTGEAVERIAAILIGGIAVGLFVRWLLRAVFRTRVSSTFSARLVLVAVRALADLIALAAYGITAFKLRDALLDQPDLARFVATDLSHAIVSFCFYWTGARFLLAPDPFGRRMLPIDRPAWHYAMVMRYAAGSIFIYVTVTLIAEIGNADQVAGWYLLTASAILLFKLWWFWNARLDFAALARLSGDGLLARGAGAVAAWVLIGVALADWVVGQFAAVLTDGVWWGVAAGTTQIAVALLPIIAAGADLTVAAALGAEDPDVPPLRKATIAVGRALACGGVWILGVVALAEMWGVYLLTPGSAIAAATLRVVLTLGIALVTGWTLWRFASAYLAEHAPKPRAVLPGVEDETAEPPAQTRLATALPLVRVVILGAVLGTTGLIVLSTLGVDIGPLLAGFGVIGLAISFGSQALVRDIVSGIFFMADDAFRIGEYIDTGRLKGTVEKITLRSVQLRHQSGLVHTIPFGQLQAITNASRDWATVKFNIRLERGSDLERARKIIKRVGQEMLEDPELANEIILPLKLQGVAEITDSAIVCRLKVTAKPARSSWVQREALKRVYGALEAEGISFAQGAVTVRSADDHLPAPVAGGASVAALPAPSEAAG